MQNSISTPKLIRSGQGQCLELVGEIRHQMLTREETGGILSLFHSRFKLGAGVLPQCHQDEDRWLWIEQGNFTLQLGGETFELGARDLVLVPCSTPYEILSTEENSELVVGAHHLPIQTNGVPTSAPKIVRAGQGERLDAFGDITHVLIPSTEVQHRFCLAHGQTPSLSGPPLHLHGREDEIFFILSGHYEFQANGGRVQAGAGDVFWAPRGVPHTFRVVSDEPAQSLILCTPGGFDDFFRECMPLFQSGPPSFESIVQISATHQISYLPPVA